MTQFDTKNKHVWARAAQVRQASRLPEPDGKRDACPTGCPKMSANVRQEKKPYTLAGGRYFWCHDRPG